MAILSREDFFNNLQARMGADTSEEGIKFVEDMTDTFNDLESRANGDGVDWQAKYQENDNAWRERYKHRFFSNPGTNNPNGTNEVERDNSDTISFKDLFK
jgi:hypothetical protein